MIGLDFSQVTTFNLDEYIGMAPDNPQSYHYFMHHNFFDFINIKPENIYIPDGMAKDIVAEGKRYDALIEAKGGIDLQILGIGQNAHIGFNEPDIKFEATTHKVRLDEETIQANSRFFQTEEEVPATPSAWASKPSCWQKSRTPGQWPQQGRSHLQHGLRQHQPQRAGQHPPAAPRRNGHCGQRSGIAPAGSGL